MWKLSIDRDWGSRYPRRYLVFYFANKPSLERCKELAVTYGGEGLKWHIDKGHDIFSLSEIIVSDVEPWNYEETKNNGY